MYGHNVTPATTASAATVPPFLALASDPVRWQLMVALASSDLQVGELTRATGQPQNLVSYHLGRLRDGGLVSSHKSSYDGRAAYYRLYLDRCGALLAATGAALHPGLPPAVQRPGVATPITRPTAQGRRRAKVLFVCTGNGTRSQIAEALLHHSAGDHVDVASAGSHPKPIHANAVRVLAELGIDISQARSKPLAQFDGRHFDYVVTLCDKVREVCPEFPGQRRATHWSIEDPSGLPGSDRATLPAFRAVATDLQSRIVFLIAAIVAEPYTRSNKEHPHHDR